MSSFLLTVRESVRYRGRLGHWSWLAHRVSGLGILAYLVIHVWETANATFKPELYEWSVALFKHPLFGVGEVFLMAALLYHAFNGTRIALLDFKPEWWRHQRPTAIVVWALFALTFIPLAIFMMAGIFSYCGEGTAWGGSCWAVPPYPLP